MLSSVFVVDKVCELLGRSFSIIWWLCGCGKNAVCWEGKGCVVKMLLDEGVFEG